MDPWMWSMLVSVAGLALTAGLAYFGAAKGTAVKIGKLETKLDELSARVEKHNGVVERMAALRAEMDDVRRRLDHLEAREDR